MKASDTVMSLDELAYLKLAHVVKEENYRPDIAEYVLAVRDRQAEASFKAGYDAAMLEAGRANGLALMEGKRAGIREVVEWIKAHNRLEPQPFRGVNISREAWQSKLKEVNDSVK